MYDVSYGSQRMRGPYTTDQHNRCSFTMQLMFKSSYKGNGLLVQKQCTLTVMICVCADIGNVGSRMSLS